MTPHISAPPRSFAASRAAAPRFAASPRAATPRFAAQRHAFAQMARGHAATQHFAATPRFAAQRRVEMARGRAAQSVANRPQPENAANAKARASEKTLAGKELNKALNLPASQRARVAEARRSPILRNPVFAGQPSATSLSRWTYRGHFAQSDWARDRHHHRHIGVVLGFAGALFWPYAYDDFLDYTYAPYAYDTFWPYAYDDVYAGIYGGYAPQYAAPENAYAYAGSPASESTYSRSTTAGANAAPSGEAARICSGQAQGLTDFSIQKIAQQVEPDQKQQALLDDLKAATVKAVNILQAACPSELPSTPTGRLAAMRTRVDAMLQAVQTIRPALEKFYASLNDEQRERFNAVDQGQQTAPTQASNVDRLCKSQTAQGRLPIERIQRTLHLSSAQDDDLKALDDATLKAGEILQGKCEPTQTLTPTGRLVEMEVRLSAMSQALATTQTALNKFYGSLSDEQKAQFDRINARAS
jgi:LTXXQ motif family protein